MDKATTMRSWASQIQQSKNFEKFFQSPGQVVHTDQLFMESCGHKVVVFLYLLLSNHGLKVKQSNKCSTLYLQSQKDPNSQKALLHTNHSHKALFSNPPPKSQQ